MSISRWLIVPATLCLTAVAVYAAAPAGGISPERKAACAKVCDTKDNASCKKARPMADCTKQCEAAAAAVPTKCQKKWDEWVSAAAGGSWGCDDNGYPKSTAAYSEAGSFQTCMNPTAGSSSADYTKPVFKECAMSGYEQFCDACIQHDCPEPALACARDKECRALNDCLLTCNPSAPMAQKVACTSKCESKHTSAKATFMAMSSCINNCSQQCQMTGNFVGYGLDDDSGYSTRNMLRECTGIFP